MNASKLILTRIRYSPANNIRIAASNFCTSGDDSNKGGAINKNVEYVIAPSSQGHRAPSSNADYMTQSQRSPLHQKVVVSDKTPETVGDRGGNKLESWEILQKLNEFVQEGYYEKASDLFYGMESKFGVKQCELSCVIAIHALTSAGRCDEAIKIFLDAKNSFGVVPDLDMYLAAIEACRIEGRWEIALALLKELKALQQHSTPVTMEAYNSCILVCAKAAKWELILCLWDEIIEANLSPSTETIGVVCMSLCKLQLWEKCVDLLGNYELENKDLAYHTYKIAISGCCRAGQWQNLCRIVLDMHTRNIHIDSSIRELCRKCLNQAEIPISTAISILGDELWSHLCSK